MTEPFVLLRQDMNPDVWVATVGDLDFTLFLTGMAIEALPASARIELGPESKTPSDFLESPYFIVSNRMRKALDAFGIKNIQYVPAVLEQPDPKKQHMGYFLANVIGLVSCVDPERSTYQQLSGNKRLLRGMVIDAKAVPGLSLFRLKENRRLVLISQPLKLHLQTQGLQGLSFQDPLKFDGKPASRFWTGG